MLIIGVVTIALGMALLSCPLWIAALWFRYGAAAILYHATNFAKAVTLLLLYEVAKWTFKDLTRKLGPWIELTKWESGTRFYWFRKGVELDVLGGCWSPGNDLLSRLPDELKLCVLHQLDIPDMTNCMRVSKCMYNVVQTHERTLADALVARHRLTHNQHLHGLDLSGLDVLTALIKFERYFCIEDISSNSLRTGYMDAPSDKFAELYCHCNQGHGWPVTRMHKRYLHWLVEDCLVLQTSVKYLGVRFARLEARFNVWMMQLLPLLMPLGQLNGIFSTVIADRPFRKYDQLQLGVAKQITTKTRQLSKEKLTLMRLPQLPEHGLFAYRLCNRRLLAKVEKGSISPFVEAAVLQQTQLWWKQ